MSGQLKPDVEIETDVRGLTVVARGSKLCGRQMGGVLVVIVAGLNHHTYPVFVHGLGFGPGICSPVFGKSAAGGLVALAARFEAVE
jgi:hypothetical protein